MRPVGHEAQRASRAESARVDQWLWAVRILKTRSAATEVCRSGRVQVNGHTVKAAAQLKVGDRVEARVHGRDRVLEVVKTISKRVGAPEASTCLVDHSPTPSRPEDLPFVRGRGSGRPTKKDRREMDRLRH
jgi:ribosome-associated heat shock protein Hsp15